MEVGVEIDSVPVGLDGRNDTRDEIFTHQNLEINRQGVDGYAKISVKPYLNGGNMLSQLPIDLAKVNKEDLDREILRAGMIAELDAINFYEQMAALTENEDIRRVLLDIAKEEKTHMGEFQVLLLKEDEEQKEELKEGEEEVEELLGK
jgi:hypothetical protein